MREGPSDNRLGADEVRGDQPARPSRLKRVFCGHREAA